MEKILDWKKDDEYSYNDCDLDYLKEIHNEHKRFSIGSKALW